jgi:hypothetical protein
LRLQLTPQPAEHVAERTEWCGVGALRYLLDMKCLTAGERG